MRIDAPYKPDLSLCEALAVSLKLWLIDLIVWLDDALARLNNPVLRAQAERWIEHAAPDIRADLRDAAQELRNSFFIQAFARTNLPDRTRRAWRPHNSASGFRHQRTRGGIRRFTGGAMSGLHQGSLFDRVRRLKRMIDNPEPIVARIVTNILRAARRFRTTSIVAVRPPHARVTSAPAHTLEHADTS